jgi:hypothetical protein
MLQDVASIKRGREVNAPATEPEKRSRCQPPDVGGIRPVGGKNSP